MDQEVITSDFDFKSISNAEEFDSLLYRVDNFHDAICHEIKMLFKGGVLQDGRMLEESGYNIIMTFHSQFIEECPVIEMLFLDVCKFNIKDDCFMGEEFDLLFHDSHVVFQFAYKKIVIESKKVLYRILSKENLLPVNEIG